MEQEDQFSNETMKKNLSVDQLYDSKDARKFDSRRPTIEVDSPKDTIVPSVLSPKNMLI